MKRTLSLLLLLWAVILGACSSDEPEIVEPVPVGDEWIDPVFAQVLQERGYIADAKTVTPLDVADIKKVDVSGTYDNHGPIKSVKGLSYFTSLKEFACRYNQLTALDVSNNTQLTLLDCNDNQLISFASKNTQLTYLTCKNNQLKAIDVSKNTQLTELHCSYNQLTAINTA